MELNEGAMTNVELQLARMVEAKRQRRRSHKQNRRERGHKSPSERARSNLRLFRFLPFYQVDGSELIEMYHHVNMVGLSESEAPCFTLPAEEDHDFDDTDWFAGNEWAEGSF
ncbi:2b protein [Cucumber mosaic virus]|uniref:2b n=1 Tax=Cucumber mosaic virus TaxID=12305 RepID=O39437_9BROM|nr:long-distance movement protein [Cucumber mosaic virus]ABI94113.1 2b protein [Cucumber mosaic virus]ABI94114.1 2b protein [Cucumber mosaic virus]ABI94125.1 2b protein [Cucumber mosaic virus]ABI94126.1 2b protein [Cucumber mosaic virus]